MVENPMMLTSGDADRGISHILEAFSILRLETKACFCQTSGQYQPSLEDSLFVVNIDALYPSRSRYVILVGR